MYVVGTDRIRVVDGAAVPEGEIHAVDDNGTVLCRERGVAYLLPASPWTAEAVEGSCAQCRRAVQQTPDRAAPAAYPAYPFEDMLLPDMLGF
jgi:hypothetical protein